LTGFQSARRRDDNRIFIESRSNVNFFADNLAGYDRYFYKGRILAGGKDISFITGKLDRFDWQEEISGVAGVIGGNFYVYVLADNDRRIAGVRDNNINLGFLVWLSTAGAIGFHNTAGIDADGYRGAFNNRGPVGSETYVLIRNALGLTMLAIRVPDVANSPTLTSI